MARRKANRTLTVIAVFAFAATALLVVAYVVSQIRDEVEERRVKGWRELAVKYAREARLDPALVLALIRAESAGNARAVSSAKARGLMQLMLPTAREMAREAGITLNGPDDLFDPETNIRLGTRYLAKMRDRFDDDPWLFLAAYNAGPTRMANLRRQHPDLSSRELVARKAPAETRQYVPRVLKYRRAIKEEMAGERAE